MTKNYSGTINSWPWTKVRGPETHIEQVTKRVISGDFLDVVVREKKKVEKTTRRKEERVEKKKNDNIEEIWRKG